MPLKTYDKLGVGYNSYRRPDPRFAARIRAALGDAASVLNVGAGAGSYETEDLPLIAVELSATMIRQRPPNSAPCVQASVEALPFADRSFDSVLAVLTVHHWTQRDAGLRELRRVAGRRIVFLTWDPEFDEQFWLTRDYLPEILELDRRRFPKLTTFQNALGVASLEIEPLPVPADCTDGFRSAYWKLPHRYLDPDARKSISAFAMLDPAIVTRGLASLAKDLESGEWRRRNRDLESLDALDVGHRIVIAKL